MHSEHWLSDMRIIICISGFSSISYPESSGSLVSGLVARRDSGEMEFFPQKSGVPVVVRMLSFIKTEVNVSRDTRNGA